MKINNPGLSQPSSKPTFTQTYATTTTTHALRAASEAHAFNPVFVDTEVEGACNDLGARINELKALVNRNIDLLQDIQAAS
jgi:hypothetical protein